MALFSKMNCCGVVAVSLFAAFILGSFLTIPFVTCNNQEGITPNITEGSNATSIFCNGVLSHQSISNALLGVGITLGVLVVVCAIYCCIGHCKNQNETFRGILNAFTRNNMAVRSRNETGDDLQEVIIPMQELSAANLLNAQGSELISATNLLNAQGPVTVTAAKPRAARSRCTSTDPLGYPAVPLIAPFPS